MKGKKEPTWYFFYSENQAKRVDKMESNRIDFSGNGKFVSYTEIIIRKKKSIKTPKPTGLWKDYMYLGCLPESLAWKRIEINK